MFVGLMTIDIQYFVDSFPESNKKIKTNAPEIFLGGPATNAAIAFSYLNKGAFLASSAGNSPFLNFIEEDFEKNNIRFTDLTRYQDMSPVIASVITSRTNGDRNIFTHFPEKIKPEISANELIRKISPEILLLDGFYPEFGLETARLAQKQGIPVVLDGGSWKPQYNELLKYTDIAICSAEFFPPGCISSNDVFAYLEEKGVKKAAISRGEKSLLFRHEEGRGEVPVKQVDVLDTLGAGDFLHGAFCYYYLHLDFEFENALKQAADLASFTCKYEGTRGWINFSE